VPFCPRATAHQGQAITPGAGCPTRLSNLAIVNLGTTTSFATLAPPGIYYVRVIAQNGHGNSGASNEIVVRVGV
jgi:hypothetical protein